MGEWVIVVHCIMNGTGVMKVYLIQSLKYAYRLPFEWAVAPTWVLEASGNVAQASANIGFEDVEVAPTQDVKDVNDENPMETVEDIKQVSELKEDPRWWCLWYANND